MAYHTPIVAAADWRTDRVCPDCGSAPQGRGYFGNPYCGLCERSIPEVAVPVMLTNPRVSADGRSLWL